MLFTSHGNGPKGPRGAPRPGKGSSVRSRLWLLRIQMESHHAFAPKGESLPELVSQGRRRLSPSNTRTTGVPGTTARAPAGCSRSEPRVPSLRGPGRRCLPQGCRPGRRCLPPGCRPGLGVNSDAVSLPCELPVESPQVPRVFVLLSA